MQRKVFRIEQMFADRRQSPLASRGPIAQLKALNELADRRDLTGDEIKRELALVQETVARNRQELASLVGDRNERRMARAAGELAAAVAGTEKATQKILQQAEGIDECAKALAATLKTDYQRGLAHDIQDHAVHIYEACNFQDLAGQRIAKVIDTLNLLEQRLSAMLAHCDGRPAEAASGRQAKAKGLINGPKLDGDGGHASQSDIDALFV